jgi:hypothetical protein
MALVGLASVAQGAPVRPRVEGGSRLYGVAVNDTWNPEVDRLAGYYTAWTSLDHPITDLVGKFGFLCDFDPIRDDFENAAADFTHSTIRSYRSASDYPLGSNPNFLQEAAPGFDCRPTNDWTLPIVEQVFIDGEARGVRSSWAIVNGIDDFDVELLLLAHGNDMMDSSIEMSLRVSNRSPEPALIGVRHAWSLRRSAVGGIARLPPFLGLREPGQPVEPLDRLEHSWEAPAARAWEAWADSGTPYSRPDEVVYAIAGALAGPESLIPAPTPPDLLQWAQMNTFGWPFFPGLADSCFAWEGPEPGRTITNPLALALTWGQDEAHAIAIDPGGEVTLTQHMMAFISYPLEAATPGPWEQDCEGAVTAVPVRAEALAAYDTEAEIFHEWTSSDPRVSFVDASAAETTALVEGTGTFPVHHRTWVGPWEAHADDQIVVTDSEPPLFEMLSADPGSLWPPNHRLKDITVEWAVTDDCDAEPTVRLVSVTSNEPERHLPGWGAGNTEQDIVGAGLGEPDTELQLRAERAGVGGGRVYTLTYEAEDASGNVSTESVQVRVQHDRGRRR